MLIYGACANCAETPVDDRTGLCEECLADEDQDLDVPAGCGHCSACADGSCACAMED